MTNETRYYKFDIGDGLMRRTGAKIEYLDERGIWVENRDLIRKFVGGDTDFDEISFEEALKIIERSRK
jgi:hypothetical protein